jgi:hypothetical protein
LLPANENRARAIPPVASHESLSISAENYLSRATIPDIE